MRRLVDAVIGIGYLLAVVAFVAACVLVYNKTFVDRTEVTLLTSSLGNALQSGSDVKLRGVPVGTVTAISPTDTGAELELALEPDVAADLSPRTSALLLPKTLFGERYVALQPPGTDVGTVPKDGPNEGANDGVVQASTGTSTGLASGDIIRQDTSAAAVELQDVFDRMLPVLESLHPAKLQATLAAVAEMLRGHGDQIGDELVGWSAYMDDLVPLVPQLADDLESFSRVADQYSVALPDLLDAFSTMTVTAGTLDDQRTQLRDVFANVLAAADTTEQWMDDNSENIIVLADQSRRALKAVRPYAAEFPCLFRAAREFIPTMEDVLGKGTDEPGVHVVLNVVPDRGKYIAGKDGPTHTRPTGPRCPYQTGQVGTTAARAGAPTTISAPPGQAPTERLAGRGLGQANSTGENQLIAELLAPSAGVSPEEYPHWGSLLLGPVLRDAEVTLR